MLSIDNIWILLALAAGIFSAAAMLTNQYFKLSGILLVIISRFFTLLLLVPFIFIIELPTNSIYYILVAMTGIIAGFADIRTLNVAAQLGGGVVSRLVPLMVPTIFISWFFVQPSDLKTYLHTPIKTIGIILTIIAISYFASKMNKCHISKEGFKLMLPVIVGYSVNALLAKIALNNSELVGGVYGYMVVQSIFALIFTSAYYFQQKISKITVSKSKIYLEKKLLFASLLLALFWIAQIASKISSFAFIDNPAYPNALVLLAPVWILIFYKITKHQEKANISAGIGIMISSTILILLTA